MPFQMTEEHKQKMAAGRKAAQEAKAAAKANRPKVVDEECALTDRITANVLKALQDAGVVPSKPSAHADEYDVPGLASRTPINALIPQEPPEPAIDPKVERFVSLVKAIEPEGFSRDSLSAMLTAVRGLETKLRNNLTSRPQKSEDLHCAVCGNPVNPQRPIAIRQRTNSATGVMENCFFDRQACVLLYDSHKNDKQQAIGPRVVLEPGD